MALNSIIEFKKASIFQGDNLILSEVDLTVDKGQFIYLIGKVGSGKTSLIKTITAELPLRSGEGQVAGYNLSKIRSKQIPYLRRKLGIVFQDFQLLTDRSVVDNLLFVLRSTGWKNKSDMKQRIDTVLDMVGLKHKDFKMPHQLSGGEQQRVVIARALLNNPEVILADEPTGNLDPDTSDEIMKILFDIASTGRAVIMATHNYSLLKKFTSKTLKCEKSRLVETEFTSEIDFGSLMED